MEAHIENILKMYECPICLDLCDDPVECLSCHKIFCMGHIEGFKDSCPLCRQQPFHYQPNIPVKKMIEELRETQLKTEPIQCQVDQCKFSGVWNDFVKHAAENHQKTIVSACTLKAPDQENKKLKAQVDSLNVQLKSSVNQIQQQKIQLQQQTNQIQLLKNQITQLQQQKPQQNAQPQVKNGLKVKKPSQELEQQMLKHVNECQNPECKTVWSGQWGKFIGGVKGGQYFDLTECPIGKGMNIQAGWDYNDPRN